MRFMIIRKADPMTETGALPGTELLTAMSAYNQEMVDAGVMRAGEGLQPSAKGFRVKMEGGKPRVTDGPFSETKELIAGFTIIDVESPEEALAWVKKWPPADGEVELEVRRVYEVEDFGEAFTAQLRDAEKNMRDASSAAAPTAKAAPVVTGVTPYLTVGGDGAAAAMSFYEKAFAAVVIGRAPAEDGKRLIHGHLQINGAAVMLSDAFPEYGHAAEKPAGQTLHLQVDDAGTWFSRAIAAGCTATMPVARQFWGDDYGQLSDPFGFRWSIGSTPKK